MQNGVLFFSARRQKWAFKEGWLLKKTEKAGASVPRPFGVAVVKTKRRAAPFFATKKTPPFAQRIRILPKASSFSPTS
ncbi:MAG: hypothetical protein IJF05_05500 [Clostridia bacterium]|nr:hypothetical protein [Clostridia bacterium]